MQIPVQVSGASFGIDPSDRQSRRFRIRSLLRSVFGFAFKNTAGFPSVQVVYNMPRPDHLRGPRSFGISVNPETFSATFSTKLCDLHKIIRIQDVRCKLAAENMFRRIPAPQLYGSHVPQAHSGARSDHCQNFCFRTQKPLPQAPLPSNAGFTRGGSFWWGAPPF